MSFGFPSGQNSLQTLLSQAIKSSNSNTPPSPFNVLKDTSSNVPDIDDNIKAEVDENGKPIVKTVVIRNLGRLDIFPSIGNATMATLRTLDGQVHEVLKNEDNILFFMNNQHPRFPGQPVPQPIAYEDGTVFPSGRTNPDGTPCFKLDITDSVNSEECKDKRNQQFDRFFRQGVNSPMSQTYNCLFGNMFAMYGQTLMYYPVSEHDTNFDPVFGEDPNKAYYEKYTLKGLVEELTEEEVLYNEFGVTNNDQGFKFKILKSTFIDTVGREPIPGDQFIYSMSNHAYEVNHIDDKDNQIMGSRIIYTIYGRSRVISGEIYGDNTSETAPTTSCPPTSVGTTGTTATTAVNTEPVTGTDDKHFTVEL